MKSTRGPRGRGDGARRIRYGEGTGGKKTEDRIGAGGGAGAQARARTEAWLHTPVLKDEDGNAPVDTEYGVGEICLLDLEEWPCAWWRRHQDEQW